MQLCCYLQSSMQKIQNCNSKEEILQIQNKELLNKKGAFGPFLFKAY